MLLEIAAEEIGDCRESGPVADHDIFGRTGEPFGLFGLVAAFAKLGLRLRCDVLGHGEEPELRVIRRGDLVFAVKGVGDAHLHVGLPGADPDVAHQHIGELDGFGAGDGELERAAGFERSDFGGPFAVRIGGGGGGFAVHADRHLLARLGPAPDRVFHVALEHHVVGKQRMDERLLGIRRPRGGGEAEQHEDSDRGTGARSWTSPCWRAWDYCARKYRGRRRAFLSLDATFGTKWNVFGEFTKVKAPKNVPKRSKRSW